MSHPEASSSHNDNKFVNFKGVMMSVSPEERQDIKKK